MKTVKIFAAFLYMVVLLFAMANLAPKTDFPIMSWLTVKKAPATTVTFVPVQSTAQFFLEKLPSMAIQ